MAETAFILGSVSGFYMTGLIWFVQLVHYPSFRLQKPEGFEEFHRHHTVRTAGAVIPAMLIEFAASAWLALFTSWMVPWNRIVFGVVVLIWLSTFLVQVPLHSKLSRGYDAETVEKLISTNRIRTLLWSLKAGLCVFLWIRIMLER